MEGLIKESTEALDEIEDEKVRDAALIAAAQRVEHYEIAGYGTARTYAEMLGHSDAAELLQRAKPRARLFDIERRALLWVFAVAQRLLFFERERIAIRERFAALCAEPLRNGGIVGARVRIHFFG